MVGRREGGLGMRFVDCEDHHGMEPTAGGFRLGVGPRFHGAWRKVRAMGAVT